MHGRRKIKTTEDKLREQKEANKQKAAKYAKLVSAAFELKTNGDKTEAALKMTGAVLEVNADCYTFWNYRREIIEDMLSKRTQEEMKVVFTNELAWLESTLALWPKSYWVWFHRRWVASKYALDWKRELELCLKLHKVDSRNFHCWNYRRWAVDQAKEPFERELAVAIGLIEENFSNYSAWHHRSIFLPKAFGDNKEQFRSCIMDEFEKVKAAFYTEPADQSAWFYHRWLVGIMKEKAPEQLDTLLKDQLQACEELLSVEENCKWAILTQVFLLIELKQPIHDKLALLCRIDPTHVGFYKDLEQTLPSTASQ